ncbi:MULTISPECIES: hypothetical protein [unclassified Streptomyces]|uniref:hypothetical protein n=1 Tax=unclassified Streptomyces TaxID=2593676 RepID=UPI001873689C|nr:MULTISPECIES: hypothetical protein [unclassified Streptomyces]
MDLPSDRPAHSGEFPSWDAALALVNHDLDALLPGRGPLRLWVMPPWDEEVGVPVYVVLPDGTWHGNQLPPGAGVAEVADAAQESVVERLWEVWPVCDEHRLGMHAREEEEAGRAVWWCSGGGGHVRGVVGELPVRRPARRDRRKRCNERKPGGLQ